MSPGIPLYLYMGSGMMNLNVPGRSQAYFSLALVTETRHGIQRPKGQLYMVSETARCVTEYSGRNVAHWHQGGRNQ